MRQRILIILLLFTLCGCSTTTVFIPEDLSEDQPELVVEIPVKPTQETQATEAVPTETAAPSTQPPEDETQTNRDTLTAGGSYTPSHTPPATEPAETQPPAALPAPTEPVLYDISGYQIGSGEYALLEQINAYRTAEGLAPLSLDPYLCAIASCRGFEASQLWSHSRPDGRHYATVLSDYGYGGSVSGELLGYTTGNMASVAEKWMSSDSHRGLLLGGCSVIGIGIYYTGGVGYVACLLIG